MALTEIKTSGIADDAVTTDKLANAINTARDANTAKATNATHSGDVTGSGSLTIADNAVTLAKMAAGTDGQIITYDASGNPTAVGPGTDGQVLTSTGAGSPPAFEAIPAAGATLTGSTDNTVCTVTGANAIAGEAYLTFNGTGDLTVTGDENTAANLILVSDQSDNTADEWRLSSQVDNLFSIANDDSGSFVNKVEIHKAGNVEVVDGDLVIGTAGHGIDFSAQTASSTTGTTVGAELFDHYEEGTWTPIFMYYSSGWSNCAFTTSPQTTNAGVYTRIGRVVYFSYYSYTPFDMSTGAGNTAGLAGLPYAASNDEYYVISVAHDNCWEQAAQNGYVSYGSDRMVFTRENDHPAATWSGSSGRYLMVSGYYHV